MYTTAMRQNILNKPLTTAMRQNILSKPLTICEKIAQIKTPPIYRIISGSMILISSGYLICKLRAFIIKDTITLALLKNGKLEKSINIT